jgi:hypothetical protein
MSLIRARTNDTYNSFEKPKTAQLWVNPKGCPIFDSISLFLERRGSMANAVGRQLYHKRSVFF